MVKQVVKRAYEVEAVTRKRVETTFRKVKGEPGLVREEKEVEVDGFMVYLPNKSSIFVDSEAELRRLNLHGKSGFVDMLTGDPVEANNVVSLKQELQDHHANLGRAIAATE